MEELENLRKKVRNGYLIGMIFIAISLICITIFFIFYNLILEYFHIYFIVCMTDLVIGISLVSNLLSKRKKEYKKVYKRLFVRKALKNVFTDLKYQPSKGIPYTIINNLDMVDMGNQYKSEDYISAKYKGINFEQADVYIENITEIRDNNGNKNTKYKTLFNGRWMIFDFNKGFFEDIQIIQKGFNNSKRKKSYSKKHDKFKKVFMESQSFNRKFHIYAKDEHNALNIITPKLIEKIEQISNNIKGKKIIGFIDGRMHIGINNYKDSFEPRNVFFRIDVDKEERKVAKDIEMITQLVDIMYLDNIGLIKDK